VGDEMMTGDAATFFFTWPIEPQGFCLLAYSSPHHFAFVVYMEPHNTLNSFFILAKIDGVFDESVTWLD
jgi:hypothetical protein